MTATAPTPTPETGPAEGVRSELRQQIARVGFAAWYGRDEYDAWPVQGMWERVADALLAGPLAKLLAAEAAGLRAERDECERWAAEWHRVVETTLTLLGLSPALGGAEAPQAIATALDALRRENAALRAALRPFAHVAGFYEVESQVDPEAHMLLRREDGSASALRVKHFRAARAALAHQEGRTDGR